LTIRGADYNDWDTIIHEYGHSVQQLNGFFPFTPTETALYLFAEAHAMGENLRNRNPNATDEFNLRVGFSEGWANFYSVLAQTVVGVSSPPMPGAGDDMIGGYSVETVAQGQLGHGEDEEVSVMRILWDLYDSGPETITVGTGAAAYSLDDNVEEGFIWVYSLVKGLGSGGSTQFTLDALWDNIQAQHAGEWSIIADFGADFEMNGVSTTALSISGSGTSSGPSGPIWSQSGGDLSFEWDIPVSNLGTEVLDKFGIVVYDDADNVVLDTGLMSLTSYFPIWPANSSLSRVSGSRLKYTLNATQLQNLSPGQNYHWAVYGSWWIGFFQSDVTGPYLSSARSFITTQ